MAPDADVAARLFVGGVLTYVLSEGLFAPGVPHPPAPARLATLVQLFVHAIAPPGAHAYEGGERR